MLFFCEECGGKNIVPDVSCEQNIVRFRCKHCQYETVVERKSQAQDVVKANDNGRGPKKIGTGPRQIPGS